MVYVTDHVEKNERKEFLVHAHSIVSYYRGKYVIESLFREIKSAVELRPFFVWKEDHVKAHYDVAVMAAYINHYICAHLNKLHGEGVQIIPTEYYDELEKNSRVVILKDKFGNSVRKAKPLSNTFKQALACLRLERLSLPSAHASFGVCY